MMEINRATADGRAEYELLARLRERGEQTGAIVTERVSAILDAVRRGGDRALFEYTKKLDGVELQALEVTRDEINDALTAADERFTGALLNAMENISGFHNRQKRQSFIDARPDGTILGQRVRGLKRVGIYVPGGTAAYPSSVLMNAVPAKIAGVEELIMTTPPARNGRANPDILAAAAIAGIDRVFLVGGAQAVAALTYGTETIPRVDKIVGPGNIYVATAKRLVYGRVDIDMIAGPSEILILADQTADPKYLAADLMSQAEHDPLAAAILLTTDEGIAERTVEEIERQIQTLSRRDIVERSLRDCGAVIVCRSVEEMADIANEIAPEHLELMIDDPMRLLGRIDNAGSVFLGKYSPEPLGDYYAGPNHVLPTGGTARFFSPLSVDSFVKRSSFISFTREALSEASGDITVIAEREGLTAHANSIRVRFE